MPACTGLRVLPAIKTEEAKTMTTETTTSGYSHTQKAPLCLILYGSALGCIALALMIGEMAGICIAGGVSLLMVLLAPAFHHLTVVDQGDVLAIRFGPIPLFHRTARYAEIGRAS